MPVDQARPIGPRPHVCVLAVHHVCGGPGLRPGGAEKYAVQTVQALLDAGADVTVAYCGDSVYSDIVPRESGQRFELIPVDWLSPALSGDRWLTPGLVMQRRRWFAALRPDVAFFVQQGHGRAFGASIAAARMAVDRVVMSIRQAAVPPPEPTGKRWLGLIPSPEMWRRRHRWRAWVVGLSCDAIIFNSRRIADEHVGLWGLPRGRCHVVPNGVAIKAQRYAAAADTCRQVDPPIERRSRELVFGCVGQIAEHKGSDVALDAFGQLIAAGAQARLVFFGEGPLEGALRRRVTEQRLPVEFAGYLSNRDDIYTRLDLLLCPSRRESSSNAVLEAMAVGRACIVSDAGGLPELIDDGRTGLVVPRGDVSALADAMRRLVNDAELQVRLGSAAREAAARDHDLRLCTARTIELILGPLVKRLPNAQPVGRVPQLHAAAVAQ